jgi:hypothetical protein
VLKANHSYRVRGPVKPSGPNLEQARKDVDVMMC